MPSIEEIVQADHERRKPYLPLVYGIPQDPYVPVINMVLTDGLEYATKVIDKAPAPVEPKQSELQEAVELPLEAIELDTPEQLVPNAPQLGVSVFDLTNTMCRYPLWDDNVTDVFSKFYCGKTVGETKCYCTEHKSLMYRPIKVPS